MIISEIQRFPGFCAPELYYLYCQSYLFVQFPTCRFFLSLYLSHYAVIYGYVKVCGQKTSKNARSKPFLGDFSVIDHLSFQLAVKKVKNMFNVAGLLYLWGAFL
jgi:hypothetical protein